MKYELKNNGKSWWVKGMLVEGELQCSGKILEINSIVVSVLEAIFESLAIQYPFDFVQVWGEDL